MIVVLSFTSTPSQLSAQTDNVGIGTANPDPSALLELNSSTKGFLLTRLTSAQRDAILQPATGLVIYNLTSNELEYNFGTPASPIWKRLIAVSGGQGGSDFWNLTGNSGLDPTKHFLGTTDGQPVLVKTNNITRITIGAAGGITAEGPLSVAGGGLDLVGANTPLLLNAQPGVAGQVLISAGASATPTWTNSLTLTSLTTNTLDVATSATFNGTADFKALATFNLLPRMPLERNYMLVGDQNNIATPFAPGKEGEFLLIENGNVVWRPLTSIFNTDVWFQGGNTTPKDNKLGNLSGDLVVVAGGTQPRLTVEATTGLVRIETGLQFGTAATPNVPIITRGTTGGDGDVFISRGANQSPQWTGLVNVNLLSNAVTINNNVFSPDSVRLVKPVTVNTTLHVIGQSGFDLLPQMPLQRGSILVGNAQNIAAPVVAGNANSVLTIRNGTPTWADTLNNTFISNLTTTGVATIAGTIDMPLKQNYFFLGNAQNRASEFAPGTNGTVLSITAGVPTWTNLNQTIDDRAWIIGGNSNPTSSILGNTSTIGMKDLDIRAGNETLIHLDGTNGAIDLRGPVNIAGPAFELRMNGNAGTLGSVMVSQGGGATPKWSTAMSVTDLGVTVTTPTFTSSTTTTATFAGTLAVTGPANFSNNVVFTLLPQMPLQSGYVLVGNASNVATPLAPGLESSVFVIRGGTPQWLASQDSPFWSRTGNTGIASTDYLGTTDANDFRLATNGTTRVTVAQGTGIVSMTSLARAPSSTPVASTDGIMVADGAGTISKRSRESLLSLLGIAAGRFTNQTSAVQYNVVVTLSSGLQLDPQASIVVTPEASQSVSVTPFVVNGSRTLTSFTINFPGGLNPGEAINWMVKNP